MIQIFQDPSSERDLSFHRKSSASCRLFGVSELLLTEVKKAGTAVPLKPSSDSHRIPNGVLAAQKHRVQGGGGAVCSTNIKPA